MIIRPMDPREMDVVLNLFNYYKEAADISDEKWDDGKVIRTIKEYCIRPHLFFRVAFIGTRPIGVIGGFLSEDPVDSDLAATIQFCYLLPEHDDIANYAELIAEFQNWARTLGAQQMRAIDIGNNIDRLRSVYDLLDFDPIRITVMNKEIA